MERIGSWLIGFDKIADIVESRSPRNQNSPISQVTPEKEREDDDIPVLKRDISTVPSLVLSLCFSCLCILIALSQYLQTLFTDSLLYIGWILLGICFGLYGSVVYWKLSHPIKELFSKRRILLMCCIVCSCFSLFYGYYTINDSYILVSSVFLILSYFLFLLTLYEYLLKQRNKRYTK